MAAITSAVVGGIGAATSIYQIAQGAKDKRESKEALANYERQELNNVYKDSQLSTVGSDLMKERSDLGMASMTDMARTGGTRGIMGALPRIQSQLNSTNREARKYLDDQDMKRQYSIANDELRIQQVNEARQNSEISGLGQQMNVGNQTMWNGINGLGNSVASGISNFPEGSPMSKQSDSANYFPGMNFTENVTDSYSDVMKMQNQERQRQSFFPKINF